MGIVRCALAVLLLAASAQMAIAQVMPAKPAPPSKAAGLSPEAIAAQKLQREKAILDCQQMWDRGTHMTKQEWSRTCRRVQDRLEGLQFK
jgi:hypothetical protein